MYRKGFFTIFIVGIDEKEFCEISKFADDTKTASWVNTLNDIRSMQRTLEKLVAGANRWDTSSNVNKCEVMHIGKKTFWVSVPDEWWLGQISWWRKGSWSVMSKDLKFSKQCPLEKNS